MSSPVCFFLKKKLFFIFSDHSIRVAYLGFHTLICQEQSTVKVIKNPYNESLKKLLSLSRERAQYGDTKVFEFVERNKNLCADDLLNKKACYHKKCFSEFTNIEKRNRAIQR